MAKIRIHSLEHAAAEGAGKIATWAQERGHALSATRLDLAEPLPELSIGSIFLVIMGGAMNVYQYRQYPWLRAERELVERAIDAGKAVLGVCLGAQMIADALGARVYQNAEEIGWLPVRVLDRDPPFDGFGPACTVFQWHGDTFDLPAKARRVAQSDGCPNQAFIHGKRVIGLQFHIEVDGPAVAGFVHGCDDELIPARYVQSADTIRAGTPDLTGVQHGLYRLLDYLAASVTGA